MPKPTKKSFHEYRMETSTSLKEVGAVVDSLALHIMEFDDVDGNFANIFINEMTSGFQKISDQVEQGKSITPYDHTSSVYSYENEKTFNVRVYWSENQIFVAITAK